jgi:hypothetical protein
MGDLADWDDAEAALAAALDNSGAAWIRNEGDGAFYGPKIDVTITGTKYLSYFQKCMSAFSDDPCQMLLAAIINVGQFN